VLAQLAEQLIVPAAVVTEVMAGPPQDPARRLLEGGFGVRAVPQPLSPRVLAWGLGQGETEVLSLALSEESCAVIVDDAAARRCAIALGIPLIGTLGVVVRAKRLGRIDSAAAVFRSLRNSGFHIDDRTVRTVLGQIGEG
jgi:predicted nucleic acid-binding protein